jgi:predicted DNA-binding ribbon-helix-helix protein
MAETAVRKRSVTIAGHRTSVSLEDAFWDALGEICRDRGRSLNALITEIDRDRVTETDRDGGGSLSGAIRVYVLDYFRRAT